MAEKKQELIGKVVSSNNNKTITVLVETAKKHPLYKKQVKYSKKYAASFIFFSKYSRILISLFKYLA